jgi:DNA-binding PadR family transcriptional regulator
MAKGPNSLEYILLGLLTLKPATGYDLKKTMDMSVRYISSVALSQIYPTLKQMAEDGLVTFEVVDRPGKTDLKIYTITPAGEQVFRRWLAEPHQPDLYHTEFFTLRFYFSSMVDRETLLRNVSAELDFRKAQLEAGLQIDIGALTVGLQPVPSVDMDRTRRFWGLYHEYGLDFLRTYIHWLEHVMELVEEGL